MSKPFLLGLLVLSAALSTARDNSRHWIEVRSPRFTILTNSSEKQGRRIAAQFERMRAVFQQSYPHPDDDPESPVLVLAVRNKDLFRVLEPGTYLSDKSLPLHGVFVGDGETNYILMRLDSQAGNPYPVVYHEYTHLFFREADQKLPLWLNEGLAEFYQNTEIYEDDVVLGEPDQQHLMLLREQRLLPLPALFNIDEKSPYYLTATEAIEHTQFKKNGQARKPTSQLFNYLAEIDQGPSGAFWVEEYRSAKSDTDSPPLSDTGTAAFALIFHPQKIGNFDFHCEGLGTIQGNPVWQLRFEESPDPSKSFHQIRIDRAVFQLRFKGRAWVTKDTFQVLRLQTDLVAPIPKIHLEQEHLEIAYAPIDFDRSRFTVWLPESASMQISYRGRRYRRVHKFSHFQLFLVVTDQTVKEPVPGPGGV